MRSLPPDWCSRTRFARRQSEPCQRGPRAEALCVDRLPAEVIPRGLVYPDMSPESAMDGASDLGIVTGAFAVYALSG
jgi:hypothetical protein